MDGAHLAELIELEETYWWHVAKRRLAGQVLLDHFPPPGRVVEGGIGSARNLLEFSYLGYEPTGLDLMPESIAHAAACGLKDVHVHDLQDPWPIEPASARAVVLLDVLEHVADPARVLMHARDTLQPGGGIVVNVPAYPVLYSDWDRSLGHYRRYRTRDLVAQARAAELRVRWLSHWNALALPPALIYRKLHRLFPRQKRAKFPRVSPAVNSLLSGNTRLERWLLKYVRIPLGLSLMSVLVPDSPIGEAETENHNLASHTQIAGRPPAQHADC